MRLKISLYNHLHNWKKQLLIGTCHTDSMYNEYNWLHTYGLCNVNSYVTSSPYIKNQYITFRWISFFIRHESVQLFNMTDTKNLTKMLIFESPIISAAFWLNCECHLHAVVKSSQTGNVGWGKLRGRKIKIGGWR